MRLIPLAAAISVLALAACNTVAPPPPPPPGMGGPPSADVFRPGDFSWSAVPGRNRIDGRVTHRAGKVLYSCAGADVVLTPETLWTRRRMTILYNSPTTAAEPVDQVRARTPSAPSGDYSAFVRRTKCDVDSKFSFTGLADGAWFVITVAKPIGLSGGQNLALMRRVDIRGGKPVFVGL